MFPPDLFRIAAAGKSKSGESRGAQSLKTPVQFFPRKVVQYGGPVVGNAELVVFWVSCIRRSGDANGSGRISTAFTTLNMAVFAPMASAIVRIGAVVKPGERLKLRTPYRTWANSMASRHKRTRRFWCAFFYELCPSRSVL